MLEFNFCNNIVLFIDELIELLKEDWIKFKIFFKENKNYIICLFVALFTVQFTHVMAVGTSYNMYTKKNNIQYGGSNAAAAASAAAAEPPKTNADADTKTKNADAKKTNADADGKEKPADAATNKAKADAAAEKEALSDNESKSVKQKLSFLDRVKGKVMGDGSKKHSSMGPIFSNLGGIFDSLESVFVIFATILIIIGILSLPIFIFLIITYCIIKHIVGKLVLY
jgi:hypothetical protein